jgi:hypothetical protein
MAFECYAQRLLNPFRGAMHVIRYEAAEAVTADGRHWDIYVTDDDLLTGLEHSGARTQVGDIRYGSWSAATGLRRGPRNSTEDFRRLEAMGDMVYDQLTRLHARIPFAFRDNYELWLLDSACQPLALLDSAIEEDGMALDGAIEWHAGYAAHDRFATAALDGLGAGAAANAGDYLTHYVNARAGRQPAAQWFRRAADGRGTGLGGVRLPAGLAGRELPAHAFPALLLADIGHDRAHRQLIDDFHAWQAVWLLTLPHLERPARHSLEQQARRQAPVVEHQYRLYPEMIDADAITAARVEARLRRDPAPARPAEDSLPAFYIELCPYFNE